MGAGDRSYATTASGITNGAAGNGEQSVMNGRCVEELTQDECRVYEQNYAGQGGTSYAFQVVDSADLPGPGCSISNQAIIFTFNTQTTNVQCGTGTAASIYAICVCVDKCAVAA